MLCAAAIANLSAERDALPDELVKAKATAIETAIRRWRPPALSAHDLSDSAKYLEQVSTGEMWRHVRSSPSPLQLLLSRASFLSFLALTSASRSLHSQAVVIFLYQAVHRHGPLSRVVREAMQQILQLGSRMLQQYRAPAGSVPAGPGPFAAAPGPAPLAASDALTSAPAAPALPGDDDEYLSAPSMRAVPWFLAGTCALLPSDRALCRRGIDVCGRQQGYRDNVSALERVWEVTDEKGWAVDWRALLQSEQRFVGWL